MLLEVVGSCVSYSLGSGQVVFLRKLGICSLCYVFKLLSCPKLLKHALISALAVPCSIHILLSSLCGYTPSLSGSYRHIVATFSSCTPFAHYCLWCLPPSPEEQPSQRWQCLTPCSFCELLTLTLLVVFSHFALQGVSENVCRHSGH
jgi:hypothetical protein